MEEKGQRSSAILLIENDDGDVFFFRRAIAKTGWSGEVRVVGTATEARAYMENAHPFTDKEYYPRPRLIVADYRLSGHTALEFVEWLHGEPALADIPIVILSGAIAALSAEVLDQIKPAGFIQKTADIEKLAEAVEPFLPSA